MWQNRLICPKCQKTEIDFSPPHLHLSQHKVAQYFSCRCNFKCSHGIKQNPECRVCDWCCFLNGASQDNQHTRSLPPFIKPQKPFDSRSHHNLLYHYWKQTYTCQMWCLYTEHSTQTCRIVRTYYIATEKPTRPIFQHDINFSCQI